MTNKSYEPRVERLEDGAAKLWVPHNGGEIAFSSLAVGPNSYLENGAQILASGLLVPTGDCMASLIHAAYCSSVKDEPEFKDVRDKMKISGGRLDIFENILWTYKGAYSIQDTNAMGLGDQLNVKELEERLGAGGRIELGRGIVLSKDRTVGFAPKQTIVPSYQGSNILHLNGIIMIVCKEEGAKKMAEASSKFPNEPYVYCLNPNEWQDPEQKMAFVDHKDNRLRFFGILDNISKADYAFGVLPNKNN